MGCTGTNVYSPSSEDGISTITSGAGGAGVFVLPWTSMGIFTSLPPGIDRLGLGGGVGIGGRTGGSSGGVAAGGAFAEWVGLISSGGAFRGSRPFRANLTSLARRTFDPRALASVDLPDAPVLVAGAFGSS